MKLSSRRARPAPCERMYPSDVHRSASRLLGCALDQHQNATAARVTAERRCGRACLRRGNAAVVLGTAEGGLDAPAFAVAAPVRAGTSLAGARAGSPSPAVRRAAGRRPLYALDGKWSRSTRECGRPLVTRTWSLAPLITPMAPHGPPSPKSAVEQRPNLNQL